MGGGGMHDNQSVASEEKEAQAGMDAKELAATRLMSIHYWKADKKCVCTNGCTCQLCADSPEIAACFHHYAERTMLPCHPWWAPQPPNLMMFAESEQDAVWEAYKRARKKYANMERQKRLKDVKTKEKGYASVSGDQSEQLHPMSDVEKNRLSKGHTFSSKEVLQLRIGEEVNLHSICTRVCLSSDVSTLTVAGFNFYAHASVYENVGWHVHVAICRECDDVLKILLKDIIDPEIVASKKGCLRIPIQFKQSSSSQSCGQQHTGNNSMQWM